ncbi:CYFA0S33e00166g1_1 [Cyberlindnera fabianii]|uniref:CYFA0S33e00166g1_1 n=1 Tax=Cyberlindnera fabianii TaxID=36022 RepID=A0A061BC63_CYBFA|nr:putative inactive serine/threonine-protein kinase slob1 [Cyberlindnera fabianii]CDR47537.1 CYFA0S33e00166g1_1 [Cyberlindnera fabianii]
MDLPDQFSFSKKPIAPNGKRLSVISAKLPDDNSKRTSTSSTGSNNSSLTNQIRTNRTFSHAENLIEEIPTDDPLLDYDEQIRAPKFAVASKKSVDDIGSVSQNFTDSHEEQQDQDPVSHTPSPLDTTGSLLTDGDHPTEQHSSSGRRYQPAEVALGSNTYGVSPAPSTSAMTNYTLSDYMSSGNMIANHEPSTSNTSPLSSKKNSDESITMLTNRKIPRFALTPIRPVDDPKTPNYIPCVLRPLEHPPQSNMGTNDDDAGVIDSSSTMVSRDHWKPNNATVNCSDCGCTFSLMNRRHHCRKCGEIFCGKCLLSKAKLNYNCRFDVNGILCKVCFSCGKEWGAYLVDSFKIDMMPDFKGHNKKLETQTQDGMDPSNSVNGRQREMSNVPADWSWSSF